MLKHLKNTDMVIFFIYIENDKLLNVRVDEIRARIDAKIREWKEYRIN